MLPFSQAVAIALVWKIVRVKEQFNPQVAETLWYRLLNGELMRTNRIEVLYGSNNCHHFLSPLRGDLVEIDQV
jgi:hypothetical protein